MGVLEVGKQAGDSGHLLNAALQSFTYSCPTTNWGTKHIDTQATVAPHTTLERIIIDEKLDFNTYI